MSPPPLQGLLALTLLVGTVNGLSRVALPLFAAALGAPAWQVGLVGGMGYTGMLLLSLPMGAWIDRYGTVTLFLRGITAAALLYFALAVVREPWQLVTLTALLGMALPLRTIPLHTEFLALLPSLGPGRAGWNRAANMTGMFFLGPALSASTVAAVGFAPVFTSAAAGLAIAGFVGRRVLGGTPHESGATGATLRQRIALQLALLREEPLLRRTMAIDFLTQMAVAYFVVFGIVLAVRVRGWSVPAAGGLVTLQGAVYVTTLLAAGRAIARHGPLAGYRVALPLLAAGCMLMGLVPHPAAMWGAAALLGVGMGLQGLLSTTQFADVMKRHGRGRVAGLTSLAPPAGGVLGAIGGGFVGQAVGIPATFVALGAGFLVTLAVAARQPGEDG